MDKDKDKSVAPKEVKDPVVDSKRIIRPADERSYTEIPFSSTMKQHLADVSPGCYQVPALVYGVETYNFIPPNGENKAVTGCNLYFCNNFLYNSPTKRGYFIEKQSVPFEYFSAFKNCDFPKPVIFEYESNPHSKYPKLICFYTD